MSFIEGMPLGRLSIDVSLHRLRRILDDNYDTLEEIVARTDAEIKASEHVISHLETTVIPEQTIFEPREYVPSPKAA